MEIRFIDAQEIKNLHFFDKVYRSKNQIDDWNMVGSRFFTPFRMTMKVTLVTMDLQDSSKKTYFIQLVILSVTKDLNLVFLCTFIKKMRT